LSCAEELSKEGAVMRKRDGVECLRGLLEEEVEEALEMLMCLETDFWDVRRC
jgi:hypothetical protein